MANGPDSRGRSRPDAGSARGGPTGAEGGASRGRDAAGRERSTTSSSTSARTQEALETGLALGTIDPIGFPGATTSRRSLGVSDISDMSFEQAIGMQTQPASQPGFDVGTALKFGALLAVAPQLGPVLGLGAIATAIGKSLPGIADQIATGEPAEFSGPTQKGGKETQSERAGGPVREKQQAREDEAGETPQLSDRFSTPLFDQIMQNILDGRSPLEALSEKFNEPA